MFARLPSLPGLLVTILSSSALAGPPVALEAVRTLEGGGRFLVGPRWSPDGRLLLASGRGGHGLFTLSEAGDLLEELAPASPAAAGWTPDGRVDAARPALDESGQEWITAGSSVLVFAEYTGRLAVLRPWGVQVLAEGAWDVRPSPDGRLVAFCLGHLSAPALVVADLAGGASWRLPGAHPAWAPDGSGLVFARPVAGTERAPGPSADAPFASSALVWWSAADGSQTELWSSGLPFQPAFSADGGRLAWSDWASGRLLVGRLRRPGVRP
ncbi:MAG TPA: hypothetical protein PK668_26080 [Myxococcota bacterium]|nr:hypothetical protein [Myxococcota bacterium]HRY96995.1 hypothetical protein [Myxococcota bacterium]HSA23028.1 hypothetical protein [Myxococcota bacterium]